MCFFVGEYKGGRATGLKIIRKTWYFAKSTASVNFLKENAIIVDFSLPYNSFEQSIDHRWSRGHKAQGQGHKKISRPRTDPLEAKAKDQGHRRKCSQKKRSSKKFFRRSQKKKVFKKIFQTNKVFKIFFSGDLYLRKPNKWSLQIFRKVSGVFQRNFNGSKIVLSSSRGQGNF